MSAHSAGAYTATLLVMVNVKRGGGRAPPPSPARTNFTLITECTPESSGYNFVYSVDIAVHGEVYIYTVRGHDRRFIIRSEGQCSSDVKLEVQDRRKKGQSDYDHRSCIYSSGAPSV